MMGEFTFFECELSLKFVTLLWTLTSVSVAVAVIEKRMYEPHQRL